MSFENDEEFELNFDDDVVDMTDPNRKTVKAANTTNTGYTGYSGYYGTPEIPSQQPQYDDVYGIYNPNMAAQQKMMNPPNRDDSLIKVLNKLYYLALIISVLAVGSVVATKSLNQGSVTALSFAGLFLDLVFLVEGIVLYGRYKRISLILSAILFPVAYPFFRSSALSESKSIPALWLVIYTLLVGLYIGQLIPNMDFSKVGKDEYASKYNASMKKFKDYQYDGRVKTIRVLKVWFDSYTLDVSREDEESLYVELKGVTHSSIAGLVTTDDKMNPNTEVTFEVNRQTGAYQVTGLKLNGESYNAYAKNMWEFWVNHTKG